MPLQFEPARIGDLFTVKSGNFHAIKELDAGDVPLVSCGDTDNGFVGFYDVPKDKTFSKALTVAYNGSWPLTAKYHPYRFAAKDDVAVLIPKCVYKTTTLLYVAACLNRMTWRYSYGRKCFREKLKNLSILVPVAKGELSEDEIAGLYRADFPKELADNVGTALNVTHDSP